MKYKRVIWDWNGTLLDDFEISIDAINEMFEERGMPKFKDKEDYLKHFCFPIDAFQYERPFLIRDLSPV